MFTTKTIKGIETKIETRVYEEVFEGNEKYLEEEVEMLKEMFEDIKEVRIVSDEFESYLVFVNNKLVKFDY